MNLPNERVHIRYEVFTWSVKGILRLLELLNRIVNRTHASELASAAELSFNYAPNGKTLKAFRLGFTNDLTQRIALTLPRKVRCRPS